MCYETVKMVELGNNLTNLVAFVSILIQFSVIKN